MIRKKTYGTVLVAFIRRVGLDVKTNKEAQRGIEILALRSEGRVEEERTAIRHALSSWKVKLSKRTCFRYLPNRFMYIYSCSTT